jgi:N-acetylmuramate 1-kinase
MSERLDLLQQWLCGILDSADFKLEPASEDASFRFYYRLSFDDKTFIVMDAPPQHEDCEPFIRINRLLHACGLNAPIIHDINLEQGFLLLSDLGHDLYLDKLNQTTANSFYIDGIKALVRLQTQGDTKSLSQYDAELLRREMDLFTEWLLSKHLAIELNQEQQDYITSLFDLLVENALQQPQTFVHRDYHSRNLMLTEDNNPGVIDYQDAVVGPITYDLVSLLKDCYIKWPKSEIDNWIDFYINELAAHDIEVERKQFQRWFDLMGVQRHLKASGIFARLSHRDNKHGFLEDVPRTLSYIVDLKESYKELIPLCQLIEDSILPRLEKS